MFEKRKKRWKSEVMRKEFVFHGVIFANAGIWATVSVLFAGQYAATRV
jgi:hypothetical protein